MVTKILRRPCRMRHRGWGAPWAVPQQASHWERSSGVGRVGWWWGAGYRKSSMLGLKTGPDGLSRREGMSWPAQHGSGGAAIAHALMTGTGRSRVNNWPRGEGIRYIALPSDTSSIAGGFVDLLKSSEVHNVVVAMWAQVSSGLSRLVTVLQQNGGSNLIRRPSAFIIGPLPKNPTAQSRRLWEQGSPDSTNLSYRGHIKINPQLDIGQYSIYHHNEHAQYWHS